MLYMISDNIENFRKRLVEKKLKPITTELYIYTLIRFLKSYSLSNKGVKKYIYDSKNLNPVTVNLNVGVLKKYAKFIGKEIDWKKLDIPKRKRY